MTDKPIKERPATLHRPGVSLTATAMAETIYTADPELQHPLRFLAAAGVDLRGAFPVAWHLFRRNLRVTYRRSFLGYLWLFLPMATTALLCLYLQSRRIVTVGETGMPYALFVLTGMTFWQFFVEALNAPAQRLKVERQLITRSRVPHEALMMAGALEAVLNVLVRLVVVVPLLLINHVLDGTSLYLLPATLAALLLLGTGGGLLIAPLGLLYDDVGRATAMITGFWFFLSPILYPIPPGGIATLNPVTPLIDAARASLTGGTVGPAFFIVTLIAIALTVFGWLLYRLAQPHVIARLG
jgi:lipopolysaccharide transport system permease protein